MTFVDTMPLWISIPVAIFLVLGATLTLLGTIGLVQLKGFYDRLHAPTLGTSWGAAGILISSMLLVSWTESRFVLHELVIGIFLMVTTPVTLMLLGRAALHRDRIEGKQGIPGAVARADIPMPYADKTTVGEDSENEAPELEETLMVEDDETPEEEAEAAREAEKPSTP